MTHATLKIYGGSVYLETDGNPLVVEIRYKGVFKGESNLPNGFIMTGNKGKILIIRMVSQPFPEDLFSYSGGFNAKRVVLYENNLKLTGKIEVATNRWGTLLEDTNTWNSETTNWQNYADSRYYSQEIGPPRLNKKHSYIVTNNIKSVSGNLVTKDGEPYYGDVHYHSDGYFMTGVSYSEDSARLYTKNGIRINNRRRNG